MSVEYDVYLERHINNVEKGWAWMQKHIPNTLMMCDIDPNVMMLQHDRSKFDPVEYDAYDRFFYGPERKAGILNEINDMNKHLPVVRDFQFAWLHHIHQNPHHWQYWVLINDEPEEGTVALEMAPQAVAEMICDWWAFSWDHGDLYEIFDWYNKHCENMILHKNTAVRIDLILMNMMSELKHEGVKKIFVPENPFEKGESPNV